MEEIFEALRRDLDFETSSIDDVESDAALLSANFGGRDEVVGSVVDAMLIAVVALPHVVLLTTDLPVLSSEIALPVKWYWHNRSGVAFLSMSIISAMIIMKLPIEWSVSDVVETHSCIYGSACRTFKANPTSRRTQPMHATVSHRSACRRDIQKVISQG